MLECRPNSIIFANHGHNEIDQDSENIEYDSKNKNSNQQTNTCSKSRMVFL